MSDKKSNTTPLKKLENAVDVATWAWAVHQNTPKGSKRRVNWKLAIQDLCEAWEKYKIETDESVLVTSEASDEVARGVPIYWKDKQDG